ncbi:HAMP domain-containing protein [Streptomyces sp. NBC_00461]|uniref:ATP-binding protein n=1 Tax=unclassified Streptomyces TaxID=2593676 RepID=UPI00224E8289|nr:MULTISPECIES: ATP-binding protein [unclassified Streptomyces]MCX5062138.1 HAMP domain-containing protein [Streptomyces sp. NBC_00452]
MSTTEVDSPARSAPSPLRGGIRGFADRWPFRRKLNLLVGIPLAVVATLLSYLIADQVGQARDAASAADTVRNSEQVASLVNEVESEHQLAVLLSVRYEAGGRGVRSTLSAYRKAQDAVDARIVKVRDAFGDTLPDGEAQALKEVEGLTSLRGTVEQGYLPASNIDPAYDNATRTVIDGLGLDRNAELAATFTGNLLDSLLRADAAHGSFETGVFSATTGDTNALIEFTTAVGAHQLYVSQAERFARFGTAQQADELADIEHTSSQGAITEAYAELQVAPSTLQATTPKEIKTAFEQALNDYPAYPQQAESRLKITSSLIDQIADGAESASTMAWWRAGLLLAAALLGFVLWLAFSVLVRRSVVRPVQALTGAAREVADVAGRELARVADEDAEDDSAPMLREMPVTARDEIGELAEVINQVQTTAVALLERQVLSRRNVAEMFGNVGRRVSNLTTRQLALIDAVERGETDPALLERLYSIDHIAVRLRRNADSLMLLAGIRETVLDSGPTALTNVVRAALGQIEGFQRVRMHARTEVMVEPDIIGDLTLMVAELLENAVSFSPEGSPVEVYVRDTSGADTMHAGGASIVISDHGLGMSPERLAEENARLIRRERLDVVPTKVLGLFVVGSLARRWDVAVELSRTPGGGMTAEVTVPSSLLLAMSPMVVSGGPAVGKRSELSGPAGPAGGADGSAGFALSASAYGNAADPAGPTARKPASWGAGADRSGASPLTGPVSGPRPSATGEEDTGLPHDTGLDGRPSPLPRRVPRRETPTDTPPTSPVTATDATTPVVATTGPTPTPTTTTAGPAPETRDAAAGQTPATPGTATGRTPTAPGTTAHQTPETRDAAAGQTPATPGTATGQTPTAPGTTAGPTPTTADATAGPTPTPTTTTSGPTPTTSGAVAGAGLGGGSGAGAGAASPFVPRGRAEAVEGVSHRRSDDSTPAGRGGLAGPVSSSQVRPGVTTPSAQAGTGPTPPGDASARPLRRRVRGATLRTTVDAGQQAARQAPRLADAAAVRDALDEFEAAVERAHRDSGADHRPATNDPHDQNHLPEGAEQ